LRGREGIEKITGGPTASEKRMWDWAQGGKKKPSAKEESRGGTREGALPAEGGTSIFRLRKCTDEKVVET